jgi:hypothetical protein
MPSKENKVLNSNNIAKIIFRIFLNEFQDVYLNKCLIIEFFFISNYFQSYKFFAFVIKNLQNLSKRTFAQWFYDFVPVPDMILGIIKVFGLLVIKTIIRSPFFLFNFAVLPYIEDLKFECINEPYYKPLFLLFRNQ